MHSLFFFFAVSLLLCEHQSLSHVPHLPCGGKTKSFCLFHLAVPVTFTSFCHILLHFLPTKVSVGAALSFDVGSLVYTVNQPSVPPDSASLLTFVLSGVLGGGVLAALLATVVMVPAVCCVVAANRRKKARLNDLMVEMGRWESGMASECRTGKRRGGGGGGGGHYIERTEERACYVFGVCGMVRQGVLTLLLKYLISWICNYCC